MDLAKIEKAETSMEYWKDETNYWYRRYIRNLTMVKRLRAQNRILRQLLSDYTN